MSVRLRLSICIFRIVIIESCLTCRKDFPDTGCLCILTTKNRTFNLSSDDCLLDKNLSVMLCCKLKSVYKTFSILCLADTA